MSGHDTVIHGGEVVTATARMHADIGIRDGRIVTIAERLADGDRRIDATGRLVLPGGIETHCHIAQESSTGMMTADDYRTGSTSALVGGNTAFVPFAAQHRGQSIAEVLATYHARGRAALIDYGFHLIVSDPTPEAVADLPGAFAAGVTSFKVFLTYDKLIVSDEQFLEVLAAGRRHGAITMVHAENNALIKRMVRALGEAGLTAPRYHAPSHPAEAEAEAISRAIRLAGFMGAPLFIVHVSTEEGARLVSDARRAGLPVFAETCPQYLCLTRDDLDRDGAEGAKFICSPPLRDRQTQDDLWRHTAMGTFACVSSDHAPYRMDASGKLAAGPDAPFTAIANGMPGIGLRLPLLFSEGVLTGRIPLEQFVALGATNAARLFGMAPEKGSIAIGADADIAIWDPEETRTVTAADQHDAMDYTPFEGRRLTGWPTTVLTRGRVALEDGEVLARPGDGRFLARRPFDWTGFRPPRPPELTAEGAFGATVEP